MTAKTISILTNPHPKSHIVYPYGDEAHVAEAVSLFAASGLNQDEAVLLIATDEKREAIVQRLAVEGFDVAQLEREGRLTFVQAEALLCQFLETDTPNPARFNAVIGEVITRARSKSPSGRVRLYGEMVNLLCGHNNLKAAAHLEALWSETIDAYSVPLLCSYATNLLEPHEFTGLPQKLLDTHSHVAA